MVVQEWLMAYGGDLQAVLFFGLLGIFLAGQHFFPRRPAPAGGPKRSITNYSLMAISVVLFTAIPLSFLTAAVWAEKQEVGVLHAYAFEGWVVIAITLFARAFVSFFTHLLNHKIPFLWRLHRVHHLDTDLDVSTTTRFHPLEIVVNLVIGLPMIVAVGMTPWVLMIYELLDATVTLFSHSNIRVPKPLNFVLRYLIVTPDLHRVHHSSWQPETDSNYGAVFPIWDQVFGTFRTRTREPQETMELGLSEVREPHASSLLWLLWSPLSDLKSTGEEPVEDGYAAKG